MIPNPFDPPTTNGRTHQSSIVKRGIRWLIRFPGSLMIFAVRMYQVCISPLIGPRCRFTPTCSSYFIEAVKKYGAIRGGFKGIWRIARCHPFCEGGHDPP